MPFKLKNLAGQKFGTLLVSEKYEMRTVSDRRKRPFWFCKCDCGKFKWVINTKLNEKTKTCGRCFEKKDNIKPYRKENISKNAIVSFSGKRFGKIKVTNKYERVLSGNSYVTRWKCKCDCGKIKWVHSSTLRSGNLKSCGCLQKELVKKLPYGESNRRSVYKNYFNSAKKRKLLFNLSYEEFCEIASKNCYYCGIKPERIVNKPDSYGEYVYNGIDRVDNTKGYIKDNCVPCCWKCNSSKNTMSKERFLIWIENIYNRLICKK